VRTSKSDAFAFMTVSVHERRDDEQAAAARHLPSRVALAASYPPDQARSGRRLLTLHGWPTSGAGQRGEPFAARPLARQALE
jgi:hypothetical protein